MKRYLLDTDDSGIVDIRAPRGRTFDLTIDTPRILTGEAFRMEVRDESDLLILVFDQTNGLTTSTRSVHLLKTAAQMELPTGCWRYDLVEQKGTSVDNLLKGSFIIYPSSTQWPP